MPDPEGQAELFPIPSPPPGSQVINDRCLLRTENGRRIVIVSGIVLAHYAVGDRIAEAHARVSSGRAGLGRSERRCQSLRLFGAHGAPRSADVLTMVAWLRWAKLAAIRRDALG